MMSLDEAKEVLQKSLEDNKLLLEIYFNDETQKLVEATEIAIKLIEAQQLADVQLKEMLQEVRE